MVVFFLNSGFSCKIFTVFFTAIAFVIYKYLLKENSDIPLIPVKNLKVKKKERTKGQLDHHSVRIPSVSLLMEYYVNKISSNCNMVIFLISKCDSFLYYI